MRNVQGRITNGTGTAVEERTERLLVAPAETDRDHATSALHADLVVVGGGLAGTCAAITAARTGLRVVLVQDRPVLGGNSSSEVRLWILGATAHMHNNNRFSREGGVVDEVLVENTYRNPEGNPVLFDSILLEKVIEEDNITLLLNTAMTGVQMHDGPERRIESVTAFCSQNSTAYRIDAPLFVDASGDGVLGFLAGAAFRMGAESAEEFGEKFAPTDEYGHLLGHSLYFYTKDVGRPVTYVPPSFALDDLTEIPRARNFATNVDGCRLWWIEWGGRLDTVHETETIKWRLWQVAYGVWNHIKNSGEHPDAQNLTLEWIGTIPGKRESRRFEGHYMLRQSDVLDRAQHDDAVSFGGWSIDLHPADGVFSEHPGSNHLHARAVYQIPYRTMVSRDVANLFLAGRIISASHVAFGSTRVMATGAHGGQAVATAAALCRRDGIDPADVLEGERMAELQRELLRSGQYIPQHVLADPDDLAQQATVVASSEFTLGTLPAAGATTALDCDRGQLLPLPAGPLPQIGMRLDVTEATVLTAQVRRGARPDDYTPDEIVAEAQIDLDPGVDQLVKLDLDGALDKPCYAVLCLMANEKVAVRSSSLIVTGLIPLHHRKDQPEDAAIGRPHLEFWTPTRRPDGRSIAVTLDPPVQLGNAEQVRNGVDRPTTATNAWIADPDDPEPTLSLRWEQPRSIGRVELRFDTDFDHAMESVLLSHPEAAMPQCVRDFDVRIDGRVIAEVRDNHQTARRIRLNEPITASELSVQVRAMNGNSPASILGLRCYTDPDSRVYRREEARS